MIFSILDNLNSAKVEPLDYSPKPWKSMIELIMLEMPLFPLNTVLFPGTPIRLHIFEERYKRMVSLCMATRQPFGVVMIRKGSEALGPLAEPVSIGCGAQIVQVQRLEEGRMNITALGTERFKIVSLDMHAQPYLIGYVEPYPIDNPDPFALEASVYRLREWVNHYIAAFQEANAGQIDTSQLPEDPLEFIYTAATLLQITPEGKQALLARETAADLLADVIVQYRREVALARSILRPHQDFLGAFSPN
jgi:Lon protease-like protein